MSFNSRAALKLPLQAKHDRMLRSIESLIYENDCNDVTLINIIATRQRIIIICHFRGIHSAVTVMTMWAQFGFVFRNTEREGLVASPFPG
jgi:hypothetical protein